MSKTSAEIIQDIQKAENRDQAIGVLHDTLEALHLSSNYTRMVQLRDKIDEYSKKFAEVTKDYSIGITDYDKLVHLRIELNFLYRDITDELTAEVNQLKVLMEESKTTRRAEAIDQLKDSEIAQRLNAKSANALRDIVGSNEEYKKYVTEMSIAYGNYKKLDNLLNSIRMMIDSIASQQHRERIVMQKDPK